MSLEGDSRAVCAQLFRLLQEERERLGMSKYAIAGETGLAQQTLGYVERGMTSPSFDTIYRMARALHLDLGELILRAEKRAKIKHAIIRK
jgi:transcriptional regulator with XRE-family HTH domain